jgi:ribose transport system substrate-binding protein
MAIAMVATVVFSGALSGSAGAAGGTTSAAQVTAAYNATTQWVNATAKLSITAPLKSAAPKGKTFVWLNCEIPACTEIGLGLKAATAAAGWKLKIIQYNQANVSAVVTAMQQALALHPVGVALSGLPEAVWQSEEAAYKKAGVSLVVGFVGPATINSTVIGNIGDGPNLPEYGSMLGNWFISDSDGTGSALNVRVNELEILKGISDGFASTVSTGCPGCTVTDLDSTLVDVEAGSLNGQIVAALKRTPSIGYVISPQGGFISGLPAALTAAGLSNIKILSVGASAENMTDVQTGTESATVGGAFEVGGFEMIDVMLRHLEHMKVDPYDGGLPKKLLVRYGAFKPANDYPSVAPFVAQFKKLWKIG